MATHNIIVAVKTTSPIITLFDISTHIHIISTRSLKHNRTMNYYSRACKILVGILVASAADSFAPSSVLSTNNVRTIAKDTHTVAYGHRPLLDIPPMPSSGACIGSSCDVVTLDAEVDLFADPNDKRYSASDWFHNIKSLPKSTILHEIKGPVGWITAWSTLVSIVYKMCNANGMGHIAGKMCLGSTPHSLIASSIGLLLVFRTNSAYERFRVSLFSAFRSHYLLPC